MVVRLERRMAETTEGQLQIAKLPKFATSDKIELQLRTVIQSEEWKISQET